MKKSTLLIPVFVLISVMLCLWLTLPESNARENNSQDFTPSRFVLVASQVNVISPEMGDRDQTFDVMVKMDTVTGRTWILQLDVSGGNQARIRHSAWLETGFRSPEN